MCEVASEVLPACLPAGLDCARPWGLDDTEDEWLFGWRGIVSVMVDVIVDWESA